MSVVLRGTAKFCAFELVTPAAPAVAAVVLAPWEAKKQTSLLEQVVTQLTNEIAEYLDVLSLVVFLGLFDTSASFAAEPTFLPSLPFQCDLLSAALHRTNITFRGSMVKTLLFSSKRMPLRAVSVVFDGLTKLPAETAPNLSFLRDATRHKGKLSRISVTVAEIAGPAKPHTVKLSLPFKRCTVECNDNVTRPGPCARMVFWSCASCKMLCDECKTHSQECQYCGRNVCVKCIVDKGGVWGVDYVIDEGEDPDAGTCELCTWTTVSGITEKYFSLKAKLMELAHF